jgi:hypothetical protein
MRKKIIITAFFLVSFANVASAGLINASDYFNGLISTNNTLQKTNNTWQLGYLVNSTFTLFNYRALGNVVGSGDQTKFDSFATSGSYTGFGVNISGGDANYFGNPIAANELYAHPGNGTPDLVLRFYASTSGLYKLNTTVRNAHTGLVHTSVKQGTSVLLDTNIQKNSGQYNDSVNFLSHRNLNVGDTVDFIIDDFNGYGADGTAINANAGLAQVPEPSTLAIFSIALLSLVRIRVIAKTK